MLFTSGLFLFIFLPFTLIGFFASAKAAGPRVAAGWLALMSFVFYGYWVPQFLILLIVSIALNYIGGLSIRRFLGTSFARPVCASFIVIDLLLLGYFKYYNFFAASLRAAGVYLPVFDIVLPIGISFFTFTQIAYLVDTYQGKVKEARLVEYILFVTYFPHLIAGPILHHSEMMPQFFNRETYRPRLSSFTVGACFLLIGLCKKVLIADSISNIADAAFAAAHVGQISPVHAWEGAIAYTLQIYFDFSGYSDMAVGISWLFGIKLPFNFNSPYQSTSVVDFWRRWHMTLSRFLRDYLYIGLGGNRRGKVRRYVNLALTMLLGGLWHGAAWTFVIWGALHGAYLVVNHAWNFAAENWRLKQGVAMKIAGWLITMLAVIVAWVFFRATSLGEAGAMLEAMIGRRPAIDLLAGAAMQWQVLTALAALAALAPNSQTLILDRAGPALERMVAERGGWVMVGLGGGIVVVIWLALVAASRANSAFIYFNF